MRIIAGNDRGRKLVTLEGQDTRPTLDRVREAMFNMLFDKIYDKNVLDLFSGSGALGLESLSRGAKFVAFNDNSKKAVEIIKTNVSNLKYQDKSQIFNCDWQDFIKNALQQKQKFDIILLDPPYKNNYIKECVENCYKLLNKGGIIVVEHDESTAFDEHLIKTKKYGKVFLTFLGD